MEEDEGSGEPIEGESPAFSVGARGFSTPHATMMSYRPDSGGHGNYSGSYEVRRDGTGAFDMSETRSYYSRSQAMASHEEVGGSGFIDDSGDNDGMGYTDQASTEVASCNDDVL